MRVHVKPDPRFVREGDDIFSTVDLTMTQAALGATVAIPTLEGEQELEFEPGTQPGQVVVLRGKGIPCCRASAAATSGCSSTCRCRGASARSSAACSRSSSAASDEHTYRHDEGFFEKLKSAFR